MSLPAWGVRVEMRPKAAIRRASSSLPAWGVRVEMLSSATCSSGMRGHSPHGECGLKSPALQGLADRRCHSPHGECGLKSAWTAMILLRAWSLPAWGVRVEIDLARDDARTVGSLPAWGVRVEILRFRLAAIPSPGHSPHGECGLKSRTHHVIAGRSVSLPAWGVRVEIR